MACAGCPESIIVRAMNKAPSRFLTRLPFHACMVALVGLFVALRFPHVAPDTARYLAEAQSLAVKGIFSLDGVTPTTRDVPGFPFLLAGFIKLGLDPLFWARLLNGLWLGLIAAGCGRLTRILTDGTRWRDLSTVLAVYAGGLLPTILGSSVFVLTELPYTALWLWSHVFLLAAVCSSGRNTPGRWALSGGLLALACYLRPIPLFYPLLLLPAAMFALAVRGSHSRPLRERFFRNWRRAALFAGAMIVVILPWTARNLGATGRFLPLNDGTGMHLYIGASQEWRGEYPDFEPVAPLLEQGMTLGEANRELGRRAVENIRRDPAAWLALLPLKIKRLWLEVPGAKRQLASPALKSGLATVAVCLLLLAAAGVWRCRREPVAWLLLLPALYVTGVHGVLFAMARFRIPAEPYLACLAAAAVAPLLGALWLRLRHLRNQ